MVYISDQVAENTVRWIEILTGDIEDEEFKIYLRSYQVAE